MPPPACFAKAGKRRGISEIYGAMLMLGVTLALGGAVASAALGQFSSTSSAAQVGARLDQGSAQFDVSLAYLAVGPTSSCPAYQGFQEGTSITVALFNYGSSPITVTQLVVNGTAYPGAYPSIVPGSLVAYLVNLASCAHQSAQTILVVDGLGDFGEYVT